MRIILAAPRGFCAGVNMAIESLEQALRLYGTPISVYHEIVHNRWVVEHFKEKDYNNTNQATFTMDEWITKSLYS